jgi:hypothetical protein
LAPVIFGGKTDFLQADWVKTVDLLEVKLMKTGNRQSLLIEL